MLFFIIILISKINARWTSPKEVQVECYREFIELCDEIPLNVFDQIITGKEIRVHHYDIKRVQGPQRKFY